MAQPVFHYWKRRYNGSDGRPVAEDFEYNSGTNPWQLSEDEMKEIIEKL
jgi:UDP-N-acetylglucosamine 4,6-dehydratase